MKSADRVALRGGMAFLQRARNAIKGGFQYRPSWFDVASLYRPLEMPRAHKDNMALLTYPEDRLVAQLQRKLPELWENTVVNIVPDPNGHIHYQHPAAAFLERWKMWMGRGLTEDAAYEKVLDDWKRQRRFERIELQVAMLQAAEQGIEIPSESPFQVRHEESFMSAVARKMNAVAQQRREKLLTMIEAREQSGETDIIDPVRLDPVVRQEDLDELMDSDERFEKHFGGDPASFEVEIERLLPKEGDWHFEEFKEFLNESIPPEVQQAIDSGDWPDHRMRYFKQFDEIMARKRELRAAEELRREAEMDALLEKKEQEVAGGEANPKTLEELEPKKAGKKKNKADKNKTDKQ